MKLSQLIDKYFEQPARELLFRLGIPLWVPIAYVVVVAGVFVYKLIV